MRVTITPASPPAPFESATVGSWWQDREGRIFRVVYGISPAVGLVVMASPYNPDVGRLYTGTTHATVKETLGAGLQPEHLTPFRGTITLEVP